MPRISFNVILLEILIFTFLTSLFLISKSVGIQLPFYLIIKGVYYMAIRKFVILFVSLFIVVSASAATNKSPSKQVKNLVQARSISAKVNINTADISALQAINGIGPKKAEAIVAYRKQNGRFASIEDLTKVKGIGEKRLKKIKQYLMV